MTDTKLPDPLVPAEVDLRGYEFMPYYGDRLRDSDLNSRATDAEYRAAHNLWWAAWRQIPASSLPQDELTLCKLADLGRDLKTWRQVKERALHGFVLCSDGRYYHRVLAPLAQAAWVHRLNASARGRAGASKKWEKHEQGNPLAQASVKDATGNAPSIENHGKGEERKGKGFNNTTPTRVSERQNLLKNPPGPEATPEHIAREKRIAALVLEGKVDEAKKVKAGLA